MDQSTVVEKTGRSTDVIIHDAISDSMYADIMSMDGATVYHTPYWHRVLQRVFGWRVRLLAGYDNDGKMEWCMPFVTKRRMQRRINVCLPLSDNVGLVRGGDNISVPSFRKHLWPVEIHEQVGAPELQNLSDRVISMIDLTQYKNVDALFRSFRPDIGRRVRKARRNGLRAVEGNDSMDFDAFAELQVETRRRQGSPTYPPEFFRIMGKEFSDRIHLHLTYQDETAVAGDIFLHFGDKATYGFGAAVDDREIWRLGVNQLSMWSGIRQAYEMNMSTVDLGTTPNHQPDLRSYKENWGAKSTPLYYSFGSDKPRPPVVHRTGPMVAIGSRVLRKLPLPVFKAMSPYLMRIVV